jgi:hypothetical protein
VFSADAGGCEDEVDDNAEPGPSSDHVLDKELLKLDGLSLSDVSQSPPDTPTPNELRNMAPSSANLSHMKSAEKVVPR